eukprot:TRINITY_DN9182_c0_g1_i1.p1 TRINITY_DN9182_c0_g1~~TRINITY_DN9182_c0_g1_i1.p1  ORF type:complete len:222 (+),score=30.06 TRINITY_DN9182_c0_g1_i1:117-782(+)
MASATAFTRLRKDFLNLQKEPVPGIEATPLEKNILEWHYVLMGPTKTEYEGGVYHGKLVFPAQFPYKPPSIYMITPNGRFAPNTRLCLSMSDFHPDTWNPLWSVSSILAGLLSFMTDEAPTYGSVRASAETRKRLARESLAFNMKDQTFVSLFPHYKKIYEERKAAEEKAIAEAKARGLPPPESSEPSSSWRWPGREAFLDYVIVVIFIAVAIYAISYVYV